MHKLLARQLRRAGLSPEQLADARVQKLLDLVDEAYVASDADRTLVERSLELTSHELLGRNRGMQAQLAARLQVEGALRTSEVRYRALFDASPVAVLVFDAQSLRILESNAAALTMYGYSREELAAMRIVDLKVEPNDPELKAVPEARPSTWHGTKAHRCKDGSVIDVAITAHAFMLDGRSSILAIGVDVTATRRLEEQLRQAQKMEAIGRLAGGVAHDFNNILSVILTGTDLVAEGLEAGHPARPEIADIEAAALRAAALTKQLLTFSRQQPSQPRALALNGVIADIQRMLSRVIGEDIHLTANLAPGLAAIEIDPAHIEQVLLNLAVNARDAMPKGGRLVIETRNERVDEPRAAELGMPAGDCVVLSVVDGGCGMDAATRVRIFDPFFTTKEVGKGTGLGLATVFGIVQNAHGAIAVESEVGVGSTFTLYFPSIARQSPSLCPATGRERDEVPSGSEIILLVEDDDRVRGSVRRLLSSMGFTVLAVDGPAAAQGVVEDENVAIDLVLTDLVMPGLDGRSMVEVFRRRRPTLPALFMSGYSERHATPNFGLGDDPNFLGKPFTRHQMATAIRRVLGR